MLMEKRNKEKKDTKLWPIEHEDSYNNRSRYEVTQIHLYVLSGKQKRNQKYC